MPRFLRVAAIAALSSLLLWSCEDAPTVEATSPQIECGEPVGDEAITFRPPVSGSGVAATSPPELDANQVCSRYECFDLCGDTMVMAEPWTLPQLDAEFSLLSQPGVVRTYQGGTVALAASSLQIFDESRSLLAEARISGAGGALEVVGDLAFVGTRSRKQYAHLVDLRNKNAPRVVSRWSMLNDERGFLPQLVGQANGELVLEGSTHVAYLALTHDGAPEVTRCVPIPFVGDGGWYWDIDVNDRFLVVSGVPRDEREGARAYVYRTGQGTRDSISIPMENTPILEGDRLLVGGQQSRVYRLSDSEPPRLEATLAQTFFDWEPPHVAGFAFLDDDFILDLRSEDLRVYQSLDSIEYDCVVELSSGSSRIALAPYFAPDGRFGPGDVPRHECGVRGQTILASEGNQAIISTRRCGLLRADRTGAFPDPLVDSPEAQAKLDEARIYAWWRDRIVAERYSRIDIVSSETGDAIGASQVLPGDVRDVAVRESQLVILSEPFHTGDVEEPRAPPEDWLIFTLDLQAPSPELRALERPERRAVVQVAIDDGAIHGISLDGTLHSWPLDGGAATSSNFLPDAPIGAFASALGVFAATDEGWWHWDGSTARSVVVPHPNASVSAVDDTFVYLHYPRGETFAAPDDDQLVLATPSITDEEVQMIPRYGVPGSGANFVVGESIALSPLTIYARPDGQ